MEKKNFDEIGDKGEVWFGEAAMNRMVKWLEKNVEPQAKIIDLGCGNGAMSVELFQSGFTDIDGVDYSAHAIDLARKSSEHEQLKFFVIILLFNAVLES